MEKFEHLFSSDPIGAFKKIEDDYSRYFRAAFKLENTILNDDRMDLLTSGTNMSKEPYIELLPEYSPADGISTMDELVVLFSNSFGDEDVSRSFFEKFVSQGLMRGLMDKFLPHGHQIGMMRKAFSGIGDNGNPLAFKNTVITSGTGSGKTESFLLPLLADIYKEAKTEQWANVNNTTDWYLSQNDLYEPCQRDGETRPTGIRALIMYPMNALVEDQMARLREALDSDDVREFMDEQLNGNRIYFGSYNGATISPKNYNLIKEAVDNGAITQETFDNKKSDVANRLLNMHHNFNNIINYVARNPQKKDALYISPRLGGERATSEMVTRWDMQRWAPDIMITNTSMLSIMLMRKAEKPIFDQTRRWLAAEDLPEDQREMAKQNRIFHIIVDELHLYRGTAGSEVACLLRMLYKALDLEPVVNGRPNPQLKILASSASLGNETDTQKYLEEFFGVYNEDGTPAFNVQAGSNYYGINNELNINYTSFAEFTHENFVALDKDVKDDDTDQIQRIYDQRLEIVNNFFQTHYECNDIVQFVNQYQGQMFYDFYVKMPQNADGSIRPIAKSALQRELFDDNAEAFRGFLIFRGFIDSIPELKNKHKLPRFRFHKFFKYVEGLWGELQPTVNTSNPPVSNLSYIADEVGPHGRKILELLRCESCHQLFIGGNRRKDDGGKVSLTLNYPSLDQIPNFNPTPMVQNKNYHDYAIFWPHDIFTPVDLAGGDVRRGAEDHVVQISDGDNGYEKTHGWAQWEPGYLNALTGEFIPKDQARMPGGNLKPEINDNGIQGYLYRVLNYNGGKQNNEQDENFQSKIFAAPCTCPHCHQNYTNRKYTNSPIRSFRTGIDRSNQILSKELLYQLDDKSAKLIGFSDSREDAAKQALGIEKEHYRDMVRMLFVECIDETSNIVPNIRQYIVELKSDNPQIDPIALLNKVTHKFTNRNARDIATAILLGGNLDQYNSPYIRLSDLVDTQNVFSGTLVRKLLEKGINPAGEAYKYQWYKSEANQEIMHHWSDAYDFQNACLKDRPDFYDSENYKYQIKTQLINAVFANSFGKYMGVSVLDAGIGYICCTRDDATTQSVEYQQLRGILPQTIEVYDYIDAFIRVLGDNYYYPSNEDGDVATTYDELKYSIKKVIREFVDRNGGDENLLGEATANFVKNFCGRGVGNTATLTLDLGKLSFKKMTDTEYIKCPNCGRVHPNKGFGFCTNTSCLTPLKDLSEKDSVAPEDRNKYYVSLEELHRHYISFDILEEKKKPRRLHTEELSGQTDDIQTRLREFKDLILEDNDGYRKTKPIDMVCVTTTMEVGVDIGSLQAIFQGNMPPTRYNYQQRVGRGGRRNQAYSAAFTFCRGRSHDVYYYKKATDEMVGGIPATPKLSLAPYHDTDGTTKMKTAIMKRVIVKDLLHEAFKDLDYDYHLLDTSGEFGKISEWGNNMVRLDAFIREDNNDIIENTVHRYFDQFNAEHIIQADLDALITWIKERMIGQIDNVVRKTSDLEKGLASYLAENGFLPMYGMPSDSRNFYHGLDFANHKVRSIDRSSEMAISEFAPGSEKTKDKGKYRVEALTVPIKEEAENNRLSFFNPDGDALADRYIISYDNQNKEITGIIEAPEDVDAADIQLSDRQRLIVIPQAYRSLDIIENKGTPVENNDKGSSFVQCELFANENPAEEPRNNPKEVENVTITLYELGFSEDPTIWHVNSNNGNFYKGTYRRGGVGYPLGNQDNDLTNFRFYKTDQDGVCRINSTDNIPTLDIALGSKKTTEMIKLELQSCPNVLNLSIQNGNKSAIRAAFYSAAFLLQRALADTLDVQPEEIEITEKIDGPHGWPVIYLSDALANGAGIVSYLYQDNHLYDLITKIVNFDTFDELKTPREKCFMQSLLSEEHRISCLTACQDCLLAYNNRGFHHVLDWRMGVGILRLMLDSSYDFGFSQASREQFEELRDFDHIISTCATKLRFQDPNSFKEPIIDPLGTIIGYKVIYHPLWNVNKVVEDLIPHDCDPNNIQWFNTFRVLRSDFSNDERHIDSILITQPENNQDTQSEQQEEIDDDDDIIQ